MKTLSSLLLLGILILWAELPPAVLEEKSVRPGNCPYDPVRCKGPEPNECERDIDCPISKKCCQYFCALRCVDPVKSGK
ncbi:porwaprin-c-like isoform X2 [Rhineura floridana]|uniref:porwaprin-c-like isoform X2 n=1 Tax=Rhineura floridana TaxID=261503 RepID=UPI002AC81CC2|nr:porwaprin-c-like isoform X2 [Rhineura floridana]